MVMMRVVRSVSCPEGEEWDANQAEAEMTKRHVGSVRCKEGAVHGIVTKTVEAKEARTGPKPVWDEEQRLGLEGESVSECEHAKDEGRVACEIAHGEKQRGNSKMRRDSTPSVGQRTTGLNDALVGRFRARC